MISPRDKRAQIALPLDRDLGAVMMSGSFGSVLPVLPLDRDLGAVMMNGVDAKPRLLLPLDRDLGAVMMDVELSSWI